MNKSSQASGSPRTKPSTRNSIRHSLNLAGKAFAEVMNKDGRDSDKSARKVKDTSSRRLSAIGSKTPAPRTSMGDAKPSSQIVRRVGTPESQKVTRRRGSIGLQRASTEEQASKLTDTAKVPTLRPRNAGTSSALPKYRPRSALMEAVVLPSPKAGARRPFSSSEDEKDDRCGQNKAETTFSPSEKISRPISPLPQRAALKANLSSAINTTLPTTPSKAKPVTPSSSKSSPQRPTKLVKTTNLISAVPSAIPRPPSSTSSAGSFTPHTPKLHGSKNVSAIHQSAQEKNARLSPSPSPHPSRNESPLARHSRVVPKNESFLSSPTAARNMSHISEGDSEDSDTEDVELLLAPVATLGAPTPAMPRIQSTRNRQRLVPKTPTRANFLPSRANMSYLSPLPPDPESSSVSLRPPQQRGERQARGSILSWEQLANEASITLGEGEVENMLSDIPAPFRAGAISPTPSTIQLDIPESPCLSELSSPGGYGSISQVLLPDVTPSPAVQHPTRYDMSSTVSSVDAATVTLLRLQLAAAENVAKERLYQLQSMEEEIHNLKEARSREAQELTKQIVYVEEQVRESLEIREKVEEQRATYASQLEDQLRQAEAFRDQAVDEAIIRSEAIARAAQDAALKSQRESYEIICLARVTASKWASIRELSDVELDLIRGDRQVLSVLLAELDQMYT